MDLNRALQFATLLTLIAAICSVFVAVFTHCRQTNASIYLELTERLQKFYQSVPAGLREAHLSGASPVEASDPSITFALFDFLHLAQSAFTLHETGFLSGKLWLAVKGEMERGLKLPIIVRQWPHLQSEFQSRPSFVRYVERVQRPK